jgi:hypothetical protein
MDRVNGSATNNSFWSELSTLTQRYCCQGSFKRDTLMLLSEAHGDIIGLRNT